MLVDLYYIFFGIQKSKKQLIILDMVVERHKLGGEIPQTSPQLGSTSEPKLVQRGTLMKFMYSENTRRGENANTSLSSCANSWFLTGLSKTS